MTNEFPVRDTIEKRRSVRSYDPKGLRDEDKKKLSDYAAEITNPFGIPTRFGLIDIESSDQPRKLGTYGVIKGASSFFGIVVPQKELALEAAGYAMEQLVLYAACMGIGTCWLAGTFNREGFTKAMQTADDEWMPAITPVGYPAEKLSFHEQLMRNTMKSSQRRPWEELFFREDCKTPLTKAEAGSYSEALELLRLAPSATNAQPWRVAAAPGSFDFYAVIGKNARDKNSPAIQRVDLGIAARHFHLTAQEQGLNGSFEVIPGRFEAAPEGWRYLFSWVQA